MSVLSKFMDAWSWQRTRPRSVKLEQPPGALERAVRLAQRVGVTLCPLDHRDRPFFPGGPLAVPPQLEWSGRVLYYDACDDPECSGNEPSVLMHNVAHYQCAPPWRRHRPEFGLGNSPGACGDPKPLVSPATAAYEERSTCLLGALWETRLGLDYTYALWDYGLVDLSQERIMRHVEWLKDQRLLTATGCPRYRVRGQA